MGPKCCNSADGHLTLKLLEDKINGTKNNGMKEIIKCKSGSINNLENTGKELVEWCVDFLLFDKDYNKNKGKHITIINFICDFLKIEAYYDYWLLSFLAMNGITVRGLENDGRWIFSNSQHYQDRHLSDERKDIIAEWFVNMAKSKKISN